MNRVVALKTMALSQEFDEDELEDVKERFFREAETAGRLSHPNIVTIYEAGEEHDLAYIAMEYLQGEDLAPYTEPESLLPVAAVLEISSEHVGEDNPAAEPQVRGPVEAGSTGIDADLSRNDGLELLHVRGERVVETQRLRNRLRNEQRGGEIALSAIGEQGDHRAFAQLALTASSPTKHRIIRQKRAAVGTPRRDADRLVWQAYGHRRSAVVGCSIAQSAVVVDSPAINETG